MWFLKKKVVVNHSLKTWKKQFEAVRSGTKTFEVRYDHDRTFEVGDVLELCEFNKETDGYGSGIEFVQVTYIMRGGKKNTMFDNLPENIVIMGIKPLNINEKNIDSFNVVRIWR